MLAKIRHAVSGLVEQKRPQEESWDLEPGKGFEPTLQFEETPAEPVEAASEIGTFDPRVGGDYPTDLLRASIEDGGRYGDYRIPLWWLQATLADLEGRYEDSKLLWDRSELVADVFEDRSSQDDPAYGRLFGGGPQGPDTSFR